MGVAVKNYACSGACSTGWMCLLQPAQHMTTVGEDLSNLDDLSADDLPADGLSADVCR